MEIAIIAKGIILDEMQKQALSLEFSAHEIKDAVFSIHDDKSPGMDGYSSYFVIKNLGT